MESKKHSTNELAYKTKRVTDTENKLMVTKGKGGEWINWEIGIDIYTLLYIKQITNKNLLGTSLLVQWLGLHLPMQGLWVQSLIRELGSLLPGS